MTAPPRAFPGHTPGPQGHGPGLKGSNKAARRDVLLQCGTCHAIATARVVGGRVTISNLPTVYHRGTPSHHGCGGELRAFDFHRGGNG